MKFEIPKNLENLGVSPVIGIILMVAVSVALVALASTLVFDITGNVNEPSTGTSVDIQPREQTDDILVSVNRNPDLERVFVRGDGINGEQEIVDSEGQTGTVSISPSSMEGNIEVVGETEDGGEQVLDTEEYEDYSGAGSGNKGSSTGSGETFSNAKITSTDEPVKQGETLSVDYEFKNTGSSSGTQTITLDVNKGVGEINSTQETISSGSTASGTLEWNVPVVQSAEDYTVTVGSEDDSKSQTVTVNSASLSAPHSTAPNCGSITYEESGTSSDPYKISNDYELQCMSKDLDGHYIITSNIDASKTDQWNGGDGFYPIGGNILVYGDEPFKGTLDGQGHKIVGLYVDLKNSGGGPDSENGGLIGFAGSPPDSVRLENMRLVNFDTKGYYVAGTLVGTLNTGTVSNVHAIGGSATVEDTAASAGGLVGDFGATNSNQCESGDKIIDSSSGASVSSAEDIGGLVGIAYEDCDIENSYSTGSVKNKEGGSNAGGLVGYSEDNTIKNSYSTADVGTEPFEPSDSSCDTEQSGGFVSYAGGVTIQNSYSTGRVEACDNSFGGAIVGGFAGVIEAGSTVENVYSTGRVIDEGSLNLAGDGYIAGLVGKLGDEYDSSGETSVLKDSYYDSQTTQKSSAVDFMNTDHGEKQGEVDGLTTSEMQGSSASANMGTFDFTNTWNTVGGDYPELDA